MLAKDTSTVKTSISEGVMTSIEQYIDQPHDPLVIKEFLCGITYDEQQKVVRSMLIDARHRENRIKNHLNRIDSEVLRDVFLMQQFFVNCLSGLKYKVAYRYFFFEMDTLSDLSSQYNLYLQYFCGIFLPLYIFGMCFYIFLFGVSIGSRATNIWLLGSLISMLQSIFILQPTRILVQYCFMSFIADEVRIVYNIIKERVSLIMKRSSGLVARTDSLIQHLNPACRAAVSFPQLPSSRLLMALHDDDFPDNFLLSSRYRDINIVKIIKAMTLIVLLLLFGVTLLPNGVQDMILELLSTGFINVLMIGCVLIGKKSMAYVGIVIAVLTGLIILRELFVRVNVKIEITRKDKKVQPGPINNRKRDAIDEMKSLSNFRHSSKYSDASSYSSRRIRASSTQRLFLDSTDEMYSPHQKTNSSIELTDSQEIVHINSDLKKFQKRRSSEMTDQSETTASISSSTMNSPIKTKFSKILSDSYNKLDTKIYPENKMEKIDICNYGKTDLHLEIIEQQDDFNQNMELPSKLLAQSSRMIYESSKQNKTTSLTSTENPIGYNKVYSQSMKNNYITHHLTKSEKTATLVHSYDDFCDKDEGYVASSQTKNKSNEWASKPSNSIYRKGKALSVQCGPPISMTKPKNNLVSPGARSTILQLGTPKNLDEETKKSSNFNSLTHQDMEIEDINS